MRLAILASHEGTVLQAVLDACAAGELDAQVVVVISNNSTSGALRRAREAGTATAHLSATTHPDAKALDSAITQTLEEAGADWVLLAGYMKKLGPKTLRRYQGRIINTHPSLLPKYGGRGFFGRRVHEAVITSGERETGVSVHLVEADYDSGPVIAQVRIPVERDDTVASLEARVKSAERKLLLDTLAALAAQENTQFA